MANNITRFISDLGNDGFEFYRTVYRGESIPYEDWDKLRVAAVDQLNRYKRIYTVTAPDEDAEDMALCAMAEALYNIDLVVNGTGGAVKSVSIGSISTSYDSTAASAVDVSPKGQARSLFQAASRYLDIYRGVG